MTKQKRQCIFTPSSFFINNSSHASEYLQNHCQNSPNCTDMHQVFWASRSTYSCLHHFDDWTLKQNPPLPLPLRSRLWSNPAYCIKTEKAKSIRTGQSFFQTKTSFLLRDQRIKWTKYTAETLTLNVLQLNYTRQTSADEQNNAKNS